MKQKTFYNLSVLAFLFTFAFNNYASHKYSRVDKQTPHKLDEVYYVTSGEAELKVEDKNYKANTGSIIFVKAWENITFIQ